MTQIGLQCSRIQALVCQGVTAGMPKHVRMDLKADLGFLAGAGEQLGKARRGERTAAFGGKDEGRRRSALELSQRPQFIAQERMRGCGCTLPTAAAPASSA